MRKVTFFLLIILLSSSALAATIAQTTAPSLNVREEPNGKVLFSLPQNTIVAIVQVNGTWAMIMHLPGNDPSKAKYGWVSAAYLKLIGSGNRSRPTDSYGVSGDDCEYEYDSNAQVCVTATDAELNCRESYDGSHYRDCEVEVQYTVSTDYEGDDYLDVDVECEVEINYKKRDGYSWNNDSDSESESHSLYSYGTDSGYMDFDFSFMSYQEVINVKIDSVECEINSVYKY